VDASAFGIALALFSALTLASANLAVKLGSDILVARTVLSISASAMLLPVALLVPLPDPATWGALALGAPAHFVYHLCLVRALQRGELSLVFPIMRGAAPLLTASAAFLLLGETLAPLAIAGLVMATGAVIVFAVPPPGVLLRHHPDRKSLLWAAATAVAVALYNVADARGVRIAPSAFTYIVWIFILDPIGITATAAFARRGELRRVVRRLWRYGVLAALLSILSYGAALYAFRIMETARVSALRETAVVFAALMGALLLKEGFGPRRILAAIALATGLVMMQLG
jgi:drug/metabolite transporter (DMT)-like permease